MKASAMFDLPIRHKPWRPSHLRWVMQDLAGVVRQPEQDHRTHLRATLEWVCSAQDTCRKMASGSVAAGWTFESGWQPASTDATGWLIETLLPAAEYLDWPDLAERAHTMLDALLAQPDIGTVGRIHGLIAGHVQLGHAACLERAVRSAHLLLDMHLSTPGHHARAAHALAAVGVVAGDFGLIEGARRYLQAALAQQTPCGWFTTSTLPVPTTELAGILRSLIESARLLDDAGVHHAAKRIAQGLRSQLRSDGGLAGAFDDGWMPAASYICISGLAQLAVCWLRLAPVSQDVGWREPAWLALAWIKRNQRTAGSAPALRAVLPSVVPIWGGPAAFSIDTLTAKHFADALMMDMAGITIPPEVLGVSHS
jgi:hypothetical protein